MKLLLSAVPLYYILQQESKFVAVIVTDACFIAIDDTLHCLIHDLVHIICSGVAA